MNGLSQLANRFTSFSPDKLDDLNREFRDYRASSLDEFPTFDAEAGAGAIDHFWAAMAKLLQLYIWKCIVLVLCPILLVLPHSNADPERLFSMVRKIETVERRQLDTSTVCDLLSVKINNDKPCYLNSHHAL